MDALQQIRRAIEEGRYELTFHARSEAARDRVHVVDLESAVLTGRIVRTRPEPDGRIQHVIHGWAADLATRVGVIICMLLEGEAVMIAVYERK